MLKPCSSYSSFDAGTSENLCKILALPIFWAICQVSTGTRGPSKTLAKTTRADDFQGLCAELPAEAIFQASIRYPGTSENPCKNCSCSRFSGIFCRTDHGHHFPGFHLVLGGLRKPLQKPTVQLIFRDFLANCPRRLFFSMFWNLQTSKMFQSRQTSKIRVFEHPDVENTCFRASRRRKYVF